MVDDSKMICDCNSRQVFLLASIFFSILIITELLNFHQNVFGRSQVLGKTYQISHQLTYGSPLEKLNPEPDTVGQSDESGNVDFKEGVNVSSAWKVSDNNNCTPIFRIVFLKTHKTASTTTASIFERFSFYHNLTFALGKGNHVISSKKLFTRKMVVEYSKLPNKTFHMLTNHARYNRREMDLAVPNATYITILRKPEDQLESAYGYFEMHRGMNISDVSNSFNIFIENANLFYRKKNYTHWEQSRNGMIFDLGLEHSDDEMEDKIKDKILQIDREFDLVMIQEYYDESLILLKKLLCWDFENILYLPLGVRSQSHRHKRDNDTKEKIRKWSHGDWLLYDHFNRSFWVKVEDYGFSSFKKDLQHFRTLNREVYDECVNPNKLDVRDSRVEKLTVKNNSSRCKYLKTGDVTFTKMFKKSMKKRFGEP